MAGLERGNVELAPYRPEWKHQYEAEVKRLEAVAGDSLHEYERIGSTAIEGMAAKPIIDLLAVVDDVDETGELIDLSRPTDTSTDQAVTSTTGGSSQRVRGRTAPTTSHSVSGRARFTGRNWRFATTSTHIPMSQQSTRR